LVELAKTTLEKPAPQRLMIGRIPKEQYYDERQKRWVWVFPKIDRHVGLGQIVDLDIFCTVIFPHSVKKQGVAKAIIETLVEEKRAMYLRELQYKVLERIKVSAQTLSDTYKAMVRSGLLEKKYRNEPTKLSRQFGNRLRDIAQYWENYLAAKKIMS
jgi:DNA-binding HxlR family transcriptional regulator